MPARIYSIDVRSLGLIAFAALAGSTGACGPAVEDDAFRSAPDDAPPDPQDPAPVDYDVIVVGAGTGGIAAAIAAARQGANVLLVEETDYIGGQASAGGVPTMDDHHVMIRRHFGGLYLEFARQVLDHYEHDTTHAPKRVDTCYFWAAAPNGGVFGSDGSHCFEPFVVREVFERWIAQEQEQGRALELRQRSVVDAIVRSGNTVTGVQLRDEDTNTVELLTARVVVDATEYGDLLPLAGAAYRVGNRRDDDLDLAAPVQDLTSIAVIRKHFDPSTALQVPGELAGYERDAAVFRRLLPYADGTNALGYGAPWDFGHHSAYRGLPDSLNPEAYSASPADEDEITKTALNWANDYPATWAFALREEMTLMRARMVVDPVERRRIECEGRRRTLNYLRYMQTELGRTDWSVAVEEGYATPYNEAQLCDASIIPAQFKAIERHMAPIPYVRDSRRLVGQYTVTELETRRDGPATFMTGVPTGRTRFATAVALGMMGNDLWHGCYGRRCLELDLEDLPPWPTAELGPYQLPMETLIPATIDGLLVADKNVSGSRAVLGGHRTQPATMASGEAAGILAAIAAQGGVQPRAVHPMLVQRALVEAGTTISMWRFDDVPPAHPRWADVQLVSLREVIRGQNFTFFVDTPMPRATMARALTNLLSLPLSCTGTVFADVDANTPGCDSIEAVHAAGLVDPCATSPLRFCPGVAAEREDLLEAFVRAFELGEGDENASDVLDAAGMLAPCGEPGGAEAEGDAPCVLTFGQAATDFAQVLARTPTAPLVEDDGRFAKSGWITGRWTRSWSTAPIAAYEYALGTTPGGTEIYPWTSNGLATSVVLEGSHLPRTTNYLSVRAITADGVRSKVGTARGVTVDATVPFGVSIGARLDDGAVRFAAHGYDREGLDEIRLAIDGGRFVCGVVADHLPDSAHERRWPTTGVTGAHTIEATARDVAGLDATCTMQLVLPTDTVLAAPDQCARVDGKVLVLADVVPSSTVGAVAFTVDGGAPIVDDQPPFGFVWDSAAMADGTHEIRARATGGPHPDSGHAVTVSTDRTAPSVAIVDPPTSAPIGSAPIVRANAPDSDVVRVEFVATSLVAPSTRALAAPPTPRAIGGIADFDGDLVDDVAWALPDGRVQVWPGALTPGALPFDLDFTGCDLDGGLQLADVADFDVDAQPDLLWFDPGTGEVVVSYLDRAVCREVEVANRLVVAAGWSIAGTGDLSGDGRPDVVWHHAPTGTVVAWIVHGIQHVASVTIGAPASPGPQLVGVIDVDGDQRRDLVWNGPGTSNSAWLMHGLNVREIVVLPSSPPNVGAPLGVGRLDGDPTTTEVLWDAGSPTAVSLGRRTTFSFDPDPPYAAKVWLVGPTAVELTARAIDLAGNTTASAPVVIGG